MRVLITREIPKAGIDLLREFPELELDIRNGLPLFHEELKKAVKGVSGMIAVIPDKVDKDVLKSAGSGLKIVAHYAVGYDNIDIQAASKLGIYVSNTPGDLTESVAEHSLALMMALGRRIVEADSFIRGGGYEYWDPMMFLGPRFLGKTLGIVGFGRIGQYFAKIAHYGLDMKILYTGPKKCGTEENAKYVTLDELLEQSDVVSLHVPLCEDTHHLIDANQLKKMKPTAYLINTSRGPVINEEALAQALKEGWLEGAALDVFENEPSVNSNLINAKNVILTPHIASATREARIQMARMAAQNVIEVLIHKRPPLNLVNGITWNS